MAQLDKTHFIGVFISVCIALCTITLHPIVVV